MIRIAQCCTPSTGDAIVGYVSRGRGITVHRIGCPSIASIKDFAERQHRRGVGDRVPQVHAPLPGHGAR